MIRTVESKDLKVGMYVILDISWFRHSFPKSHFKLISRKQIERIIATGIKEVKVDTSKSDAFGEWAASAGSPVAKGGQSRSSGRARKISKDSKRSTETESGAHHDGGEKQPEPDSVSPHEESEGSGIDTIKIGGEEDWDDSGIVSMKTGKDEDWDDSGIVSMKTGKEGDWDDSGIVSMKTGKDDDWDDSGIVSMKTGKEGDWDDSGIVSMNTGKEDDWDDSGIVSMKTGKDDDWDDSGIVSMKTGKEDDWDDSGIISMKTGKEDDWDDSGIDTVSLDMGRSDPDTLPPPDLVALDIIAAELRETLQHDYIPPMAKASAVYQHSQRMMENLFARPSAENIGQGKEMVRDIVDLIIAEDEVANLMVMILPHDYHTYTHSTNVGVLSILLAKAALKDSSDYDMVELGAGFFLHDLGKTQIPAQLLSKPGKLSEAEWKIVRRHPSAGEEILAATNVWTAQCARILLQHHEREDGTGYPQGLSGGSIDLSAQICRIADVYDALTSHRPYKTAPVLPAFQALETMKASMVNHYNADLFKVFVSLFSK